VSHPERSEGTAVLSLPEYEVIGPKDAPVVVALGGISANRHICSNDADPSRGWWEDVARSSLQPPAFRLVGIEFIDGGTGADGRPEREITTTDQADAVAAVLDQLSVERVHALIGASYGGMVALAFAEKYPERVERLVVISAAHRTHGITLALKVLQRRIVELGLDTGRARDGVILARGLAITTFRTERDFDRRFSRHPERSEGSAVVFPVESYLRHHGEKFADRFSPARFLALSLSGDLHNVDPSRVTARTTLVAADGDRNVPRELIDELASQLGGPSRIVELKSEIGHDAFLTETEAMSRILRDALGESV
jgi:homoserine O-acetyltransferase